MLVSKKTILWIGVFSIIIVFASVSLSYFYLGHPYLTSSTSTTMLINPSLINLDLEISSIEGKREFREVAVIDIEDADSLLFRLVNLRVEGIDSISLSGIVRLESTIKSYEVRMPCIVFFNTSCPRITMIIPGYDAPLKIDSGRYILSIEFTWMEVKGKGKISLTISPRAYNASIISLGEHAPEDTSNWITARGSTRSFALLVDKNETVADSSGFGKFKAYVWVFQSVGENVSLFMFEIVSLKTGKVESLLETYVEKKEIYYKVLLLVKARPGDYRLRIIHPIELAIDLKVR